ncbi:esterase [Acidovorax sp. 1608163]|uniref:lipase family protein n=1 Tax=Acidovorax sp. 1608163 TaxID=2478662 RepID=UPI000EF6D288|nr:lipase family protein [Acidovorax sp. 1608163]AYM98429.1 esterase [Acidovorax sp. 1608163]
MTPLRLTCVAAAAALLAACGGSDDSVRGELIDPPTVLTTLTVAQIDAATAASGLQALSGKAKCDVKVVALNYRTPGVKDGEMSNASGAMLVPAGACAAAAPLVVNARGTEVLKTRTLANPQDPETFLLVAMYAAQGYAVVATDYLGYAKSTYGFHPYLHADSQATTIIDSARAARNAADTVGAKLSGKVMFTGYSQGGHASMAAHRAAERDHAGEFNVVAGAHLAGPYNLSGSLQVPNAIAGVQFFLPMIVTSWQKVYGNIYLTPAEAFKAPYASYIEALLPNPTLTYTTLVTSGNLPGGTPTQARDALFQPAFLASAQQGGNNPLYLAGKKNDLLGWTPKARVLLCGGAGDPTVPPAVHQVVMKADFDKRGVTNVTSVDVDAAIQTTYGPGGKAPTDATSAAFATYYGNYHGTYEPPLCHAQARGVFDAVK